MLLFHFVFILKLVEMVQIKLCFELMVELYGFYFYRSVFYHSICYDKAIKFLLHIIISAFIVNN